MNDIEAANRKWQDERTALSFALAQLAQAQAHGNQRNIQYYYEQIRNAQEAEARAYTLARQQLTS